MPYVDPEKARRAKRESARRRRAAASGGEGSPSNRGAILLNLPARIQTAADILAILSEAVADIRAERHRDAFERGRAVGYLCGIALRAVEAADLLARVERIEAAMEGDARAESA